MTQYTWVNDPRKSPEKFPKEGIGLYWDVLCIQGEPRLVKRMAQSLNDFSWQFDLFIRSTRYPTQGIILVKQHNTEGGDVELTVMGRDEDLSLKQLEQAYEIVVGVLDGKVECFVPIDEIRVKSEHKAKPKKESTKESKSKSKKVVSKNSKGVEPSYLVGYD